MEWLPQMAPERPRNMMRIDQLLVQRGLASTRSQAQRLIASGVQWKSDGAWKRVAKNGDEVAQDAEIALLDDSEARFVSRGGLKLEGALRQVGLSVAGALCLDLGQSTGGFTDCLLRHGAAHVVGVDVGFGQLHEQLRSDARVTCIERVNARQLCREDVAAALGQSRFSGGANALTHDSSASAVNARVVDATVGDGASSAQGTVASDARAPAPAFDAAAGDASALGFAAAASDASALAFDAIVGDLSFISQTLVLPAAVPMLTPGGAVLMLVKPQFELQPGQVGRGGIVTDVTMFAVVEQRVRAAHAALGLKVLAYFESPIQGGDGNREFFIFSRS